MDMIRIAVDAAGGDNAPMEIVRGAVAALGRYDDIEILLYGDEAATRSALRDAGGEGDGLRIVHAPGVITNHDHPVTAIRTVKDSPIVMACRALAAGEVDAFVSAGSTGALLVGGHLIVRTMESIHRPALAPMMPTAREPVLLIDCGANMDAKPLNLVQFAEMASVYLRCIYGRENPRVGLVNVGEEEEKGNELVRAAYPLLAEAPINFIGNIEARQIPEGDADIVVCDAFVGNVILKLTEGLAGSLMGMLKKELTAKAVYKLPALMLKGAFRSFRKRMDYEEYGGSPLLGLKGCVFKCHGSSEAKAAANAIGQARSFVANEVIRTISEAMGAG